LIVCDIRSFDQAKKASLISRGLTLYTTQDVALNNVVVNDDSRHSKKGAPTLQLLCWRLHRPLLPGGQGLHAVANALFNPVR
jgi:hypothetical protein